MALVLRSTQPDMPPRLASPIDGASDPHLQRYWLRGLRAGKGIEIRVVDTDGRPETEFAAIEISATGVAWKQAVRAKDTAAADTDSYSYDPGAEGTDEPLVWTGVTTAPTWDGVNLTDGDRVLITESSDTRGRGIFVYDATAQGFRRAPDSDNTPGNEVVGGLAVLVLEGATHAGTAWTLASPLGQATLGTDALVFAQFSAGGGGVVEGTGIDVTGGVVSVDWANAPVTTTVADTDLLMLKTATGQEVITRGDFVGGASIPMASGTGLSWPDGASVQHDPALGRITVQGSNATGNDKILVGPFIRLESADTIELICPSLNIQESVGPGPKVQFDPGTTTWYNIFIEGTTAIKLPSGTTSQRPTSLFAGACRFNTDVSALEVYDGTNWVQLGGGGSVSEGTGIDVTGGVVSVDWTNAASTTTVADTDTVMIFDGTGHKSITRSNFITSSDSSFPTTTFLKWPEGGQFVKLGTGNFGGSFFGTISGVGLISDNGGNIGIGGGATNKQLYAGGIDTFALDTNDGIMLTGFWCDTSIDVWSFNSRTPGAHWISFQLSPSNTEDPALRVNSPRGTAIGSGTTAERPTLPAAGSVRLNTDTGRIEYYDGAAWKQYIPAEGWSYAEVTYTGTNPIPGFFTFAPFSQNTVQVYVNRDPLRNSEFAIVNGVDLQIIGYPVNNGDTVWARYA